jgi:hypothetical protein
MHPVHRTLRSATVATAAAALALVIGFAGLNPAGAAAGAVPKLPQTTVAQGAANWLVGQFNASSYIPTGTPGQANLSSTLNSVIALAAANVDLPLANAAMSYMEANANTYIAADPNDPTHDGPAQLANLILAEHALGRNPAGVDGNLVTRLEATEQTSGPNAGLFGTDTQLTDQYVGAYQQGLVFTALRAVGVAANSAAVSWLDGTQCPNGGFTSPDPTANACNGDPASFDGPDTNSTALALQGLVAQGALTPSIQANAVTFLKTGQDADGGWGYMPNAPDNQEASDPNSTAVVIQGLLAAGLSPDAAQFAVAGGSTPTTALLSFRITSGSASGAFYYPPATTTGDLSATDQAVPALVGLSFPFGPSGASYQVVGSDGGVFSFGSAPFHGSLGSITLNKPIVASASTLDGQGYWLAASDGGVFGFGNAGFYGSMGGKPLNKPVVGLAGLRSGAGYWLVASDGGIFSFGSTGFYGSMGGKPLNKPIVGMAATPDGGGYWLVASDGGIFSFGDASFYGSMGGKPLNQPIVGMAATPDGGGYWLVASDGGIFTFGDAAFEGSSGSLRLNAPVVGMTATPDGGGYWLVASDGGIFNYGDAIFSGSAAQYGVKNVVGIAATAP